jgi:hypothetical protein
LDVKAATRSPRRALPSMSLSARFLPEQSRLDRIAQPGGLSWLLALFPRSAVDARRRSPK